MGKIMNEFNGHIDNAALPAGSVHEPIATAARLAFTCGVTHTGHDWTSGRHGVLTFASCGRFARIGACCE